MDFGALGLFVSVCAASTVSLIHAVQHSRCTKIQACCVSCDRDVSHIEAADEVIAASN
jgi:hypothetical protein